MVAMHNLIKKGKLRKIRSILYVNGLREKCRAIQDLCYICATNMVLIGVQLWQIQFLIVEDFNYVVITLF